MSPPVSHVDSVLELRDKASDLVQQFIADGGRATAATKLAHAILEYDCAPALTAHVVALLCLYPPNQNLKGPAMDALAIACFAKREESRR